jgi:hypothetical protein
MQELAKTRIDAERIALPDVDERIGQWHAAAHVDHRDAKVERHARLVLADIASHQALVEIVRTEDLLRTRHAHSRVRREPEAGIHREAERSACRQHGRQKRAAGQTVTIEHDESQFDALAHADSSGAVARHIEGNRERPVGFRG